MISAERTKSVLMASATFSSSMAFRKPMPLCQTVRFAADVLMMWHDSSSTFSAPP